MYDRVQEHWGEQEKEKIRSHKMDKDERNRVLLIQKSDEQAQMNLDHTIVAIATPPGRGGIGVVRLAGPESKRLRGVCCE